MAVTDADMAVVVGTNPASIVLVQVCCIHILVFISCHDYVDVGNMLVTYIFHRYHFL